MSTSLRKVAYGAATLLAAGALGVTANPAGASFPSSPSTTSILTSSGTEFITFEDGRRLLPHIRNQGGYYWGPFSMAKWSPDGSRAVFVDHLNQLATVRYNDDGDLVFLSDPPETFGTELASPTYRGDGSSIVYSTHTPSGHWGLVATSSSPFGSVVPITPDDGADYQLPEGGADGKVVFVRRVAPNPPEIWIWDGAGTGAAHLSKVTDGSAAAISPNGTRIAYSSGGHVWTSDLNGANAFQVTTDTPPNGVGILAWSADGQTIAFGSGDFSTRTVPAAGGESVATSLPNGHPAYQSQQRNQVTRLSGPSRWETATAVSQYHWKTASDGTDTRAAANAVVLSRSDSFADALGGAALAAAKQGPLLLTPPASLYSATQAEIQRVLGTDINKTVYILGSTGAVSAAVETQVRALGYQVKRIQGADRFGTSIAIANEIDPTPDLILAATGMNFPDALAAGAAAGSYDVPGTGLSAVVVLTTDTKLSSATKSYLDSHVTPDNLFAIGNQAIAATGPYDRFGIAGPNRYATAEFVGEVFFGGQNYAAVATGTNWPDALAGGALMGTLNGPLLLTPGTASTLDPYTTWHLSTNASSIGTALVFGGPSVVNTAQLNQSGTWISGPAGFTASALAPGVNGLAASSATGPKPSTQHRSLIELREAAAHFNDR